MCLIQNRLNTTPIASDDPETKAGKRREAEKYSSLSAFINVRKERERERRTECEEDGKSAKWGYDTGWERGTYKTERDRESGQRKRMVFVALTAQMANAPRDKR